MKVYTKQDGLEIKRTGTAMLKRPNPVYMIKLAEESDVETNEGTLVAHAGDFVAHDPISGHVWPVAASYVEQHYEPIKEPKLDIRGPKFEGKI